MANQSLTLNFPDDLYQRLKARAEGAQRSIEDELLSLAAAALDDEPIPLDIQAAVASLSVLDDAALWQVARASRLSQEESDESEELHFRRQRGERLTDAEKRRLAVLMHQYDKSLLVRSHALLLLKQRGHDITPLLQTP
ncbi:MAG TPA: hypothetical protein VH599_05865 [Ktedonobacterales bacterium]|jgi:plasmid stability protein